MKFVVDTGALLSLACSEQIILILEEYEFITTNEVEIELVEFSKYNDFLGKKAQDVLEFLKQNKIRKEKVLKLISLKISSAELSVFSLGSEKKYLILTDDMHAARVAEQQLKIVSKPSFFVLFLLYKKKKITKQQLLSDIEIITQHRNWLTGTLYKYVKDQIELLK